MSVGGAGAPFPITLGAAERSYVATRRPEYRGATAATPLSPSSMATSMPVACGYPRGSSFLPNSFRSNTAFIAGPRRDPLSREAHVAAISASGRGGLHGGSAHSPNTFGAGVIVPACWPGSWETDVSQRSNREPLRPAPGARSLLGAGAAGAAHPSCGILGTPSGTLPHFEKLATGCTEEQKRLLLITNERHRRHAERRYAPTDTLGIRQLAGPHARSVPARTPAPLRNQQLITPHAPARPHVHFRGEHS